MRMCLFEEMEPGDAQAAPAVKLYARSICATLLPLVNNEQMYQQGCDHWYQQADTVPAASRHEGAASPQSTSATRQAQQPTRRSLDTTEAFMISALSTPTRSRSVSLLIATSPHIEHAESDIAHDDLISITTTVTMMRQLLLMKCDVRIDMLLCTCIAGAEDDEDGLSLRGSEPLAVTNNILNAIETNESPGKYGATESGDEAETDDVDTGDLGGEDEVLRGNLKADVLRSMATSGWEDVVEPDIEDPIMEPYEPVNNSGSYPGFRQGYSGPTPEALRHGNSPVVLSFTFCRWFYGSI
ncbi:hypothetical protein PHYPSEUDO_007863 [Phytophthora pseudosyringae]|uniref:Uncharacterized protein n=1 Tax=Phytophthora pseudosyringae TaxID=221518 RepID=A0A8T1VIF9_9STRA|nr:hypothetical protein PHYPSEUDO_007863 [Phytophthora pseudosyringae]